MRLGSAGRWLPAALLVVGWAFGWVVAWQLYLFDLLALDPGPGATVLGDAAGDRMTLWIATGVSLVLGSIGVFFLVSSNAFRSYSVGWSRVWLGIGWALIIPGLSAPILYPSTKALVFDEPAQVVALEQHWLYAETTEAARFDRIARVSLRVRRTLVGSVPRGCQIASGLSIVRFDKTWLEIPNGFDHELVAKTTAEIANVPLESLITREC